MGWVGGGVSRNLLAVMIWLVSCLAGQAETRVALVIGNSTYQNTPALTNPVNDAEDTAAALERVGFSVQLERNLDKRGMDEAIARFARLAQNADAALFYFAGHGLQHRGANYLMPVDARLVDEFSLTFELSRVDDVLFVLERARGVKILVLDACRNNPLAEKMRWTTASRDLAATRGLAKIEPTRGMITVYATQTNQVAVDGSGRNSPFTAALIKEIDRPGIEIATMFRRVAIEVNRLTDGRQLPEVSVSLLGEFYLNTRETDLQAWAKIRTSSSSEAFQKFISEHPQSVLVSDARERLAAIEREERARAERERAERLERERLAREQAELAERARVAALERERFAREQAERERLERERSAGEQAERERLQREAQAEEERKRIERDRLERERLAAAVETKPLVPLSSTSNIQTTKLSPAADQAQDHAGALVRRKLLVLEIKAELNRVGCYAGNIDDKWADGVTKRSIAKFAKRVSLNTVPDHPSSEFLDAIRVRVGRVCPLECNAQQILKDGRCVLKAVQKPQRNRVASKPSGAEVSRQAIPQSSTESPVLNQAPALFTIPHGQRVLVNDGSCKAGQIREITGGKSERGIVVIPRSSRCVTATRR